MVGSLSSALMTAVTAGRNTFPGNSSVQWGLRVVVGTPCFLLVATVAATETVAYTIFAAMALPFYPLTIGPFTFFGERLKSSSFTALWAVAVATIFNRRPIDLPVQESGARFYAAPFNPTAIPLVSPPLFIQSILDEMEGFGKADYNTSEFIVRLFEAIIFRCFFLQKESKFFLTFLKEETNEDLTQLKKASYSSDAIEVVRKKIFTNVQDPIQGEAANLWKKIAGIASQESQGSALNKYLGKLFGIKTKKPNLSFRMQVLPTFVDLFVVFMKFLILQSAARKGSLDGKGLGCVQAGYMCGRIFQSFHRWSQWYPRSEFASQNPKMGRFFFLSNGLLFYNTLVKAVGQVTNKGLLPLLPALTGMVFKTDAAICMLYPLPALLRPNNILVKIMIIFSSLYWHRCVMHGDVLSGFKLASETAAKVCSLYLCILDQST